MRQRQKIYHLIILAWKKGWMKQQIFQEWFEEFLTQIRKHLDSKKLTNKVVLLIDNAISHSMLFPTHLQVCLNLLASKFSQSCCSQILPRSYNLRTRESLQPWREHARQSCYCQKSNKAGISKHFLQNYIILHIFYLTKFMYHICVIAFMIVRLHGFTSDLYSSLLVKLWRKFFPNSKHLWRWEWIHTNIFDIDASRCKDVLKMSLNLSKLSFVWYIRKY